MPTFEITKQNILNPLKSFIETTIEAGLMRFSYNGKKFKIVEEGKEVVTQGQKLAQIIGNMHKNEPVNTEKYITKDDYKKFVKGMDYERWSE